MLGQRAMEIFRLCDQGKEIIVIPSIVLLECLYICEKKRVEIDFKKILLKIRGSFNYLVYPLDEEIVIECQKLKEFPDLHDRVIIATTKLLNTSLTTKDKKIRDSKVVGTVW